MAVRVGSGWLKGMTLATPAGLGTRPTASRTREAVANMLVPYWQDTLVLDLFAGSGALGFEAISRGARGAVWVEQGGEALRSLRANREEMRKRAASDKRTIDPQEILAVSVDACWSKLRPFGPFGLVWADPPYQDIPHWAGILAREAPGILNDGGILAVEGNEAGMSSLRDAMRQDRGFQLIKDRRYGYAHVLVWQFTWVPASSR